MTLLIFLLRMTLLRLLTTVPTADGAVLLDSFYFDPAPVDQEVTEGSEVRMRCDVSDGKNITFGWLFNGKQMSNQSRRYQDGSDLVILRADRNLDAGVYTCIATNVSTGIALRSTGAKLTIQWIESNAELQLLKPDATELFEENELILKCAVVGEPEPMVDWYKNYARLFASDRIRPLKHRLRIFSLASSDEGIYTCKGRNVAGETDFSNIFPVSLSGKPSAGRLESESFTSDVVVRMGDSAEVVCRFENSVTFWFRPDKSPIRNGSKYTITDSGHLIIGNFSVEDEGLYLCSPLQSLTQRSTSRYFAIRIQLAYIGEMTTRSFEPRPLQDQLVDYVIPTQGRKEITCFAPEGNPQPSLRWENAHGQAIGNKTNNANKTLVLANVQEGHSGNYTCVAENLAGARRYSVWTVSSVLPKISLPPLSTRVVEGGSAQFECRYVGSLPPITTVWWTKDDLPISLRDSKYRQNGTLLRINEVSGMDEGNYACSLVTVGHSRVNSPSARLYVEKQLKFRPIPVNAKLELHSKSSIPCRAEGKLSPTIEWFRDRSGAVRSLAEADDSKVNVQGWSKEFQEHVTQSVDGDLSFDGVQREDEGLYLCRASNEEQGYINATIYVHVVVRPKFKVTPKNATVLIGSRVSMNCMAVGEPTPYLQWDKNGQVIDVDKQAESDGDEKIESRIQVHKNGSLTLTEAEIGDTGRYGCTAGNSGGLERHEAFVNVMESDSYVEESGEGWTPSKTAIIAIFSAFAYMLIVIIPTVFCIMKAKKKLKSAAAEDRGLSLSPGEASELVSPKSTLDVNCATPEMTPSKAGLTTSVKVHKNCKDEFSDNSSGTISRYQTCGIFPLGDTRFSRDQLNIIGLLGKGKYGDVYLAKLQLPVNKGGDGLTVIVKSHTRNVKSDLDHDIGTFSSIEHDNVAKILHVCRKASPMLVISEHCEWGDLKHFLVAMRNDNGIVEKPNENHTITGSISNVSDLSCLKDGSLRKHTYANVVDVFSSSQFHLVHQMSVALQCASGMDHLSSKGLIHGDLAARNVLIDSRLRVKISNLGMAFDPYSDEYEEVAIEGADGIAKTELLPIRWMAPEVISNCGSMFSKHSDIWSYGVLVWEIFTLGKRPLDKLNKEQIFQLALKDSPSLRKAYHWPSTCPLHVVKTADKCIAINPEARPSFVEIVSNLAMEDIV